MKLLRKESPERVGASSGSKNPALKECSTEMQAGSEESQRARDPKGTEMPFSDI